MLKCEAVQTSGQNHQKICKFLTDFDRLSERKLVTEVAHTC